MKYFHRPITELPHNIGEDFADGTRFLRGEAGHGSYGPYCHLEPGRYFGGFHIRAEEPTNTDHAIRVEACCNAGDVLDGRWFSGKEIHSSIAGLRGVEFTVEHPVDQVEIRLFFNGHGSFIVSDLVLFRTDIV